ncbi:MAG: integrase core domain-containing protein [Candidatus Methanomethylicaceae archaeon]
MDIVYIPMARGFCHLVAVMDWASREVYLKAYQSMSHAKVEVARFLGRYKTRRPHRGLNGRTTNEVHYETLPGVKEAV